LVSKLYKRVVLDSRDSNHFWDKTAKIAVFLLNRFIIAINRSISWNEFGKHIVWWVSRTFKNEPRVTASNRGSDWPVFSALAFFFGHEKRFCRESIDWDYPHVFHQNVCRQKVISQKVFSQNVFGQNVSWNHNYSQIKKSNLNYFNSKNKCGKNARFSCVFCSERKSEKLTYL